MELFVSLELHRQDVALHAVIDGCQASSNERGSWPGHRTDSRNGWQGPSSTRRSSRESIPRALHSRFRDSSSWAKLLPGYRRKWIALGSWSAWVAGTRDRASRPESNLNGTSCVHSTTFGSGWQ